MIDILNPILDWLLEVAKILIPAVVTIVTYRKMTASQDPKLDAIEQKVNGNLEVRDKKIESLQRQLRNVGVEPEQE